MNKWHYYNNEESSNYGRAIEKLNKGAEVTLKKVFQDLFDKYPVAWDALKKRLRPVTQKLNSQNSIRLIKLVGTSK